MTIFSACRSLAAPAIFLVLRAGSQVFCGRRGIHFRLEWGGQCTKKW